MNENEQKKQMAKLDFRYQNYQMQTINVSYA